MKEREEEERKVSASKSLSTWGSTVGKRDRSRKSSGLSQKKNWWADAWDFPPAEKKGESSGLPPITTPPVPGGMFDGAANFSEFFSTGTQEPRQRGV